MGDSVGIVGVGEYGYAERLEGSLEEVVHRTARAALADAGIDREAVDEVVLCASDQDDGRAISSMVTVGPGGGYDRDFIKTTDTGVHALGLAAMRLAAGHSETALVLSWAKASEADEAAARKVEAEPFTLRGTGLGHRTGHAVTASAYADATDRAAEAADAVSARNTRNRADNELAARHSETTRAAAANSPVVAWPLREAHLPQPSDGGCGIVLATDDWATRRDADVVRLAGVGWETDSYDVGTREHGRLPALAGAGERAYGDAGIDAPRRALDAAEVHASSAMHELVACEELGLCEPGEAPDRALDGAFDRDGALPVNPSGGPFAANPLVATGLARVAAAARLVRGDAPGYGLDGVDTALAHASAGFTDGVHGVAVLGGGSV